MNKPIAVLISDIHYSLSTLELADSALRKAVNRANALRVPLVIAGDLHDTKANFRAECMNRLITTIKQCDSPPYIIVGNHDLINEKSEEHGLHFLEPYAMIIDHSVYQYKLGYLVPYHSNPDKLRVYLKTLPKNSQLIMHQGLKSANSGEYFQDHSAITHEDVSDFRVISGHYHYRQDIMCGEYNPYSPQKHIGVFSYIGNPYTLNYGEANDPEKGFQVLMSDGSLEFVPTNLRKHQVIEISVDHLAFMTYSHKPGDLLWLKVKGTREELQKVTKDLVRHYNKIQDDFKLDLIFDESPAIPELTKTLTNEDLLDSLIDSTDNSDERKAGLKELWRKVATNG